MEGYDLMSGTLPRHLNQSFSQLYALSIGSRRISGTLPETLGAIMLAFGAITSALSGTVHSGFQKHILGLKLDFSSNQISGTLPAKLMPLALAVSLRSNAISGTVQRDCWSIVMASSINLGFNRSALLFISLVDFNKISGCVPSNFSMQNLQLL
jgi:hypothetical protein